METEREAKVGRMEKREKDKTDGERANWKKKDKREGKTLLLVIYCSSGEH